ncbi:hypothetical protein CRYUN_Cryun12cG0059900 [Craigia yunnanensis]
MHAFIGCFCLKKVIHKPGYEKPIVLASETPLEALYDLFKKLSGSIIDDGLIHKGEFQLALFKNSSNQNLFADRVSFASFTTILLQHFIHVNSQRNLQAVLSLLLVFDLFDVKRNGVIEFGEFVRSLSVFHPSAPEADKIAFLFRLYDLRQTGYIEREEVKQMILAFLDESDLILSDDVVEAIVDKTFEDADSNRDGKIDLEEGKEFVARNPALLKSIDCPIFEVISSLAASRFLSRF